MPTETIPSVTTPFRWIIETAIRGEEGEWRQRGDGWRFWPSPNEPYVCVMLLHSGTIHVNGRLAAKVEHIPGSVSHDDVGYVGLKWLVTCPATT